jgi:hypothetical protein
LTLSLAAAQPVIPPNDMGGRERERFIESPVERFMKPGRHGTPEAVDRAPERKRGTKRKPRRKPP